MHALAQLDKPSIVAPLTPGFRPAALIHRAFERLVGQSGGGAPVVLALEQSAGNVFHHALRLLPEHHAAAALNFPYVERIAKFMLWSRGGHRLHISGPRDLAARLAAHYRETPGGRFDAAMMGERIYGQPFDVRHAAASELPPPAAQTAFLGRHLDGCRIGFDLGASDRKVAAVIDGEPVFSEEVPWTPGAQDDPQWHFDQIMDSLRRAAKHLPRVDAIGGSSAGVYVDNHVRVATLFKGVPPDLFNRRVRKLFLEIRDAWGVPLEILNDGEVTALAGSMIIGDHGVLGIAMGSSEAAGYVTLDGHLTSWLNELAFAPVDYNPDAPRDDWSGDRGCGAQYFSQQCVGRLLDAAGIALEHAMPLPEKLEQVQALMKQGDERAARIYETIGVYFGYGIAHYAEFYAFRHVLALGRVMTGKGGDIIIAGARRVLEADFPALATRVRFSIPDEKFKRHGQAIAAASLAATVAKTR